MASILHEGGKSRNARKINANPCFLYFLCFNSYQYGFKLAQVCRSWRQVGSSRLQVDRKLDQIGSMTAQEGRRCGHAGQIFVSLGFSNAKKGRDPQRGAARIRQVSGGDPAGSTLSWAEVPRNALSLIRTNNPGRPRDMGRGTMSGSNTPWAQGTANYKSISDRLWNSRRYFALFCAMSDRFLIDI